MGVKFELFAAFVLSTSLSVTLCIAQSNGTQIPRATVHVETLGPFGSEIDSSKVQLRLVTKEGKLTMDGKGDKLVDVPYGAYILSAWDNGGGYGEREITINTKELWLRMGLMFPFGDRLWPGGGLTVSGSIRPTSRIGRNGGLGLTAYFFT